MELFGLRQPREPYGSRTFAQNTKYVCGEQGRDSMEGGQLLEMHGEHKITSAGMSVKEGKK